MYSHTCCADYNLVQDYTLCCIAYTEWYYTKGVNCQIFTQKGINFLRSFWKNLHRTEKIYTGTACGACDKYEVWIILFPVTCESLVSREFSRIILQFHFSISISRHFNFTFTSRKEWNQKSFHFSFLEKSESISNFTLFSREKRVKLYT